MNVVSGTVQSDRARPDSVKFAAGALLALPLIQGISSNSISAPPSSGGDSI